jgi:hypothetical protein
MHCVGLAPEGEHDIIAVVDRAQWLIRILRQQMMQSHRILP